MMGTCECNERKFDFHVYMESRFWLHIAPFQGQCDRVQGSSTHEAAECNRNH